MPKRYSATSVERQFVPANTFAISVAQNCPDFFVLSMKRIKNLSKCLIALDE